MAILSAFAFEMATRVRVVGVSTRQFRGVRLPFLPDFEMQAGYSGRDSPYFPRFGGPGHVAGDCRFCRNHALPPGKVCVCDCRLCRKSSLVTHVLDRAACNFPVCRPNAGCRSLPAIAAFAAPRRCIRASGPRSAAALAGVQHRGGAYQMGVIAVFAGIRHGRNRRRRSGAPGRVAIAATAIVRTVGMGADLARMYGVGDGGVVAGALSVASVPWRTARRYGQSPSNGVTSFAPQA